jgi:hypothetical protein
LKNVKSQKKMTINQSPRAYNVYKITPATKLSVAGVLSVLVIIIIRLRFSVL